MSVLQKNSETGFLMTEENKEIEEDFRSKTIGQFCEKCLTSN